jgi:hypothetical protein
MDNYLDINYWGTKDPTPLLGPGNVIVSSADSKPYKTVTPYWFDAHDIHFANDAEAAADGYYGMPPAAPYIADIYYIAAWAISIEGIYAVTTNDLEPYPLDYAKTNVTKTITNAGLMTPEIEKQIEDAGTSVELAAIYEDVLGPVSESAEALS